MLRKTSQRSGANARVSSRSGALPGGSACTKAGIAATDRALGRLPARLKKEGIPLEQATFRLVENQA